MVGSRTTSSVPTQALYLMNSAFIRDQATAAAKRLLSDNFPNDAARIRQAYQRTLGRNPTERERDILIAFLARQNDAANDSAKTWSKIMHSLYGSLDFRFLN